MRQNGKRADSKKGREDETRRCVLNRRDRGVLFWSEPAVLQETLSTGMPLSFPLALTAVSSHQPLQEATTPHRSVLHGPQPCLPQYSSFSSQRVPFPQTNPCTHTHTHTNNPHYSERKMLSFL